MLEFNIVREMLSIFAASQMGKALCLGLMPQFDLQSVKWMQQETTEAKDYIANQGHAPIADFPNIEEVLLRCKIGATLSFGELLDIARCLKVSREAKNALSQGEGLIYDSASMIRSYKDIEDRIFSSILSDEEMADAASSELSTIRRKIRRCNERIREKLNAMIHSSSYSKYLQDPIITIRNDRFVIPVRQEFRQNVQGMLHDQSASGATLFIEPMAVVEINNELKSLLALEKAEIERILKAISGDIMPDVEDITENIKIVTGLDVIFAKAYLSKDMKASQPELSAKGSIDLKQARHPLIPKDAVVPVDIRIEGGHALLITGPNTGGKTVTLKTIGLLTLMAQSGLHVPALEGAKLSVFENIYADIGDEQSIEQSLSTFSSHMKNIVAIIKGTSKNSLVLLDELGSGTDPTEGAALAMAILDELLARGCTLAATTHYSELKEYALVKENIENACMEFDINTLRPTYRLFLGIPGSSNAFEISKRLGLGSDIIEKAKRYVSLDDVRFEEAIRSAEQQRAQAEKHLQRAEMSQRESRIMHKEAEAMREKAEKQQKELLSSARQEARKILENARHEAENTLLELKKLPKEGDSREKARELTRRLEKEQEKYFEGIEAQKDSSQPPKTLRKGDSVKILSLANEGTVLQPPNEKGEVQVMVGIMKMTVHLSDLRLLAAPKKVRVQKRRTEFEVKAIPTELHVRMQTIDEAVWNIDKYLDEAIRAGLTEVRIIHGKGTGALRAGVQQHLKSHPCVKSFRLGMYGEGESGVTVVELK